MILFLILRSGLNAVTLMKRSKPDWKVNRRYTNAWVWKNQSPNFLCTCVLLFYYFNGSLSSCLRGNSKRKKTRKSSENLRFRNWLGTPTWPPFRWFKTLIWPPMTSCENSLHIEVMNYLGFGKIFNLFCRNQYISLSMSILKQENLFFPLAYSLKHARDLVRAITKKVKNQLPASTSQRSQPALPGIGTGHVPLMLPPIKKDRWVKQVQLVRWWAGRSSFMNRLAELERILGNSVVMTGESKQFDSELRSYSSHLLFNWL